jgi:hypothetical protein
MTEKFCLKWNDFQENVSAAFGYMREDTDLSDVTLACEDGQQVEAHKVILAASSPFFQNLFRRNRHQHPLVYMRGIKSEDLAAIVDFMYRGETNIDQENLDGFLAIAEELNLKGLTGAKNDNDSTNDTTIPKPQEKKLVTRREPKADNDERPKGKIMPSGIVALQNQTCSDEIQLLDEQIRSMMSLGQNLMANGRKVSVCNVCLKEGTWQNTKNHIEANHIDGISLPCSLCEKSFRSRNSLRMHKSTNHRDIIISDHLLTGPGMP